MTEMTEKEFDARHEAAHVAMYCLRGCIVQLVVLQNNTHQNGFCGGYVEAGHDLSSEDEIRICMAGPHIDIDGPFAVGGCQVEGCQNINPTDEERIERLLSKIVPNDDYERRQYLEQLKDEVAILLDAPDVLYGIGVLTQALISRLVRGECRMRGDEAQSIFKNARSVFHKRR